MPVGARRSPDAESENYRPQARYASQRGECLSRKLNLFCDPPNGKRRCASSRNKSSSEPSRRFIGSDLVFDCSNPSRLVVTVKLFSSHPTIVSGPVSPVQTNQTATEPPPTHPNPRRTTKGQGFNSPDLRLPFRRDKGCSAVPLPKRTLSNHGNRHRTATRKRIRWSLP